jgi:hypothetical protein
VIERTSDAYALMARDANLAVHDLGEMRDLGHRMGDEGDRMHMLRFERAAG